MGESSIVRSDYKFVKFKDSWHTGLLYKFVFPFPASSLLHTRQGVFSARPVTSCWDHSMAQYLSLWGFVLLRRGQQFLDHVITCVCLISWKLTDLVNNFSILFLLFPSTETACCSKRLSRVQWSCAGHQCLGSEFDRLVQQSAIWLRVTLGMYGTLFLFFRLNKGQHELVLCCWFLFSISWGLFAF